MVQVKVPDDGEYVDAVRVPHGYVEGAQHGGIQGDTEQLMRQSESEIENTQRVRDRK
jgi:hypothetical protein